MQSSYLVYIVFRSFLLVVSYLPFRLNSILGKLMGGTYYRIDRFRRRVIRANISIVFGTQLDRRETERLGKESCECLARNILDLLRLNRIVNSENYHRFIEIKGFSNLMKAVERGKGTVVVTGHFGNVVLMRYVCYLNIPSRSVIIRKLDNPYLERYVSSILKAHDVIMVRPDGALGKIRRLFLQNTIAVTLADQKAGGSRTGGRDGMVVDFFGIPSQTHITGPYLAAHTGASIVPVFVIRKGPGKYTIEINEPLKLVDTDNRADDLRQNTRKLNQIFEHYIRRYPEQWFWLHRRWKDIPGLEGLYETNDPLTLIGKFRRELGKGSIGG
jgi:KDO2-lipid IV(A) lauroyltransferase